jgi:hypothetical protein
MCIGASLAIDAALRVHLVWLAVWRTMLTPSHEHLVLLRHGPGDSAGAALVLAGEDDDLSPFLIFAAHYSTSGASEMIFMWPCAQLARHHGAEDTGADRLLVLVDQHGGVAVEADHAAVGRRTSLRVRTITAFGERRPSSRGRAAALP